MQLTVKCQALNLSSRITMKKMKNEVKNTV